jgi:hypothetical protein
MHILVVGFDAFMLMQDLSPARPDCIVMLSSQIYIRTAVVCNMVGVHTHHDAIDM